MKKLLIIFLVALGLIGAYVLLSPYRYYSERDAWAIVQRIEIDTPAHKLYSYLGNSSNAADWSSYVSRIEPLNEPDFTDGSENSKRRCFYKKDDSRTWDELIDSTREKSYRRLRIYNLKNFPLESENLLTEQIYLGRGSATELSLTLYLSENADVWDHLKMLIAAPIVSSIFEANLEKIKAINEG